MELSQKNIKSSSLKGFKDNLKMNFQINTNLAVYASMLKYIIIVHFYFLHFLYMIYLLYIVFLMCLYLLCVCVSDLVL